LREERLVVWSWNMCLGVERMCFARLKCGRRGWTVLMRLIIGGIQSN
jgi:hypothetical protein